jgi:serine/threonine protein kinase
MLKSFFKIAYLRLKYRYIPNEAQEFWAQELLNSQGLSAKLGQVLSQGKESKLPKSSVSAQEAKAFFLKQHNEEIQISDEVLAASMGQVFHIQLQQKDYALKILHPGIRDKLKKEIDNILLLGKYFSKAKGFSFDQQIFKRFLTEVFQEETDLLREADFQEKFYNIFKDDSRFKVPVVMREFSDNSALCQEWVDSTLAKDLSQFENFNIFTFFFEALLVHGTLHGDLNDRNWGVNGNGQVVVFDFGCSQIVSPRRISGFKKLLMNEDVTEGFLEFGIRLESTWFKGREQQLRDALFEPLLQEFVKPEWSYSKDLESEFGEKIKLLREFTDPWVLLMMRSLFSLIRIYQNRKTPIPLKKLLAPYLIIKKTTFIATQIKIEVMERDSLVMFLELPVADLGELEEKIPEKVIKKIQQEGLVFKAIIKSMITSGLVPQELINVRIEDRTYRVWID